MNRAQLLALSVIVAVLLSGVVAYGVLRLYAP